MRSKLLGVLLLATIIVGLLVASAPFGKAQASTNEGGIISSNTTWILANSPFTLTGNLLVSAGVVLTIEAGVTVNLNNYYMMVNGTLHANGVNSNQIIFNNGSAIYGAIVLNSDSGSIIENAVFSSGYITVNFGSPEIDSCSIFSINVEGGSPTISYNSIKGGISCLAYLKGSPIILHNVITGTTTFEGFSFAAGILVLDVPVTISYNNINHGIALTRYSSATISYNNITGGMINEGQNDADIYLVGLQAQIFGNNISGGKYGISLIQDYYSSTSADIHDNGISECTTAGIYSINTYTSMALPNNYATIEANSIVNNGYGIQSQGTNATLIIQGNTIANNEVGIYGSYSYPSTLTENNILSNSQNSIYWTSSSDGVAPNNWWGTTDQQAINQTIYDFKNDFTLGTINFVPFLTAPNPQAMPNPNEPLPTSNASTSPTPSTQPTSTPFPTPTVTPAIPEFQSLVFVLTLCMAVSLSVVVVKIGKRRTNKTIQIV
jgi:hypothetical protein